MPNVYHVNTQVKMAAEFKNAAGALVDPATVTYKVWKGNTGAIATATWPPDVTPPAVPSIIRVNVGQFEHVILADSPGRWHYEAHGKDSGGRELIGMEGYFDVQTSRFH